MNSTIVAEDNPHARSEASAGSNLVKQRRYHALSEQPTAASFLSASNDAAFDRQQSATGELTAWAQRASMANGFGEIGVRGGPFPFAVSHPHQQPERGNGSASLREVLAAMVDAVRNQARRWSAQWKQYQFERATYCALNELDARTLHDIGLARSELHSVAVELTGEAEPTRAHALMRLRSLSI